MQNSIHCSVLVSLHSIGCYSCCWQQNLFTSAAYLALFNCMKPNTKVPESQEWNKGGQCSIVTSSTNDNGSDVGRSRADYREILLRSLLRQIPFWPIAQLSSLYISGLQIWLQEMAYVLWVHGKWSSNQWPREYHQNLSCPSQSRPLNHVIYMKQDVTLKPINLM